MISSHHPPRRARSLGKHGSEIRRENFALNNRKRQPAPARRCGNGSGSLLRRALAKGKQWQHMVNKLKAKERDDADNMCGSIYVL